MVRFVPVAGCDEDAGIDEEHARSDAACELLLGGGAASAVDVERFGSPDSPTPMNASSGSSSSSAMNRSTRTCGSTPRRCAAASSFAASSSALIAMAPFDGSAPDSKGRHDGSGALNAAPMDASGGHTRTSYVTNGVPRTPSNRWNASPALPEPRQELCNESASLGPVVGRRRSPAAGSRGRPGEEDRVMQHRPNDTAHPLFSRSARSSTSCGAVAPPPTRERSTSSAPTASLASTSADQSASA